MAVTIIFASDSRDPFDVGGFIIDFTKANQPSVAIPSSYSREVLNGFIKIGTQTLDTTLDTGSFAVTGRLVVTHDGNPYSPGSDYTENYTDIWHLDQSTLTDFATEAGFYGGRQQAISFGVSQNYASVVGHTFGSLITNGAVVFGSEGADSIATTNFSERVFGAAGDDVLKSRGGDDWIVGGDGSDVLDGGPGADRMEGGAGTDVYIVDNIGDRVIENGSSFGDGVESSITFSLPNFVYDLTLTGQEPINGVGNDLQNTIIGNAATNLIDGDAGADTITGGAGSDTFSFTAGLQTGIDAITDFSRKDDTIELENSIFTKLTDVGVLKDKFFELGFKAHDKNDYILYFKKSGELYYDADGSRHKHDPILFAILDNHAKLHADDFLVG